MNLREELAALFHEQWMKWSKTLAPEVSLERQERWKASWIDYSQLTDEYKALDREWADKAMKIFEKHSRVRESDLDVAGAGGC
jgi:hypothetical protein